MFQLFNNTGQPASAALIKMCGFTRVQDIECAIENNVNAVGFVFYPKSQRYIDLEQAKILTQNVPENIQVTGLFVNANTETIANICEKIRIDLLQFHGDLNIETPEWCRECAGLVNKHYIKAVGIHNNSSTDFISTTYDKYMGNNAQGILLDTKTSGYGGSGVSFNWDIIPKYLLADNKSRIILSGGINLNNLLQALALQPYAVDLSSAVENGINGIKDTDKIKQIMHLIKSQNNNE